MFKWFKIILISALYGIVHMLFDHIMPKLIRR